MAIPRRVEVGPHAYKVSRANLASREEFGHTDFEAGAIRVHSKLTPEFSRETLLHEVLHACMACAHVGLSEKREEAVVSRLAPILLDTLQRNEALVRYLIPREESAEAPPPG